MRAKGPKNGPKPPKVASNGLSARLFPGPRAWEFPDIFVGKSWKAIFFVTKMSKIKTSLRPSSVVKGAFRLNIGRKIVKKGLAPLRLA
jgi:hypothetical protein